MSRHAAGAGPTSGSVGLIDAQPGQKELRHEQGTGSEMEDGAPAAHGQVPAGDDGQTGLCERRSANGKPPPVHAPVGEQQGTQWSPPRADQPLLAAPQAAPGHHGSGHHHRRPVAVQHHLAHPHQHVGAHPQGMCLVAPGSAPELAQDPDVEAVRAAMQDMGGQRAGVQQPRPPAGGNTGEMQPVGRDPAGLAGK